MSEIKINKYTDYVIEHAPTGEKLSYSGRHNSWSWFDPTGNCLGLDGEYDVAYRLENWDLSSKDLNKLIKLGLVE